MSDLSYIIRVTGAAKPVVKRQGNDLDFQRRTAMAIDVLGSGSMLPIGMIVAYPKGLNAPPGWLLCDGSEIGRASFPALFALIGTTYGTGDGTTTFNIPDFRAAAPVPDPAPPSQPIVGGAVTGPPPGGSDPGGVNPPGGGIVVGGRPPLGPEFTPL